MGNDGGSIPKRRELVRSAARAPTLTELKATALESLSHAWQHCPLSGDRLDLDSAVSDWRGRLYNYESVLKGLMPAGDESGGKDEDGERNGNGNGELPDGGGEGNGQQVAFASTGIKSLRDVVRLRFKRYSPAGAKGDKEVWACPVSLKELGPSTRSVYLVRCGHVFAEVAIKQIPERTCPECSEGFKEEDVVPILSADEAELKRLSHRMEDLRVAGLTHSLKKDKSGGKRKRKAEDGSKDSGEATRDSAAAPKKSKSDVSSRVGGINNAMTASLTAKVMAEQEERGKQRKLAMAAGA